MTGDVNHIWQPTFRWGVMAKALGCIGDSLRWVCGKFNPLKLYYTLSSRLFSSASQYVIYLILPMILSITLLGGREAQDPRHTKVIADPINELE